MMIARIAPARSLHLLAALCVAGLAPHAAIAAPAPASEAAIIKVPLEPIVAPDLRSCSARTASGLGYSVLRAGTGPKPGKTDFALIGYIGYLATTGQVFDQNASAPINLDGVIPGFGEGITMMPRGSVWRLCVPAALGYGAKGAGDTIPANADLVFQIELIDSKTAAEVDALRKAQEAGATATPPAHH